MMQELLDFFLGAIHIYVTDPELLPVVDACACLICLTLVLYTACSIIVWSLRLLWSALWGGSHHA